MRTMTSNQTADQVEQHRRDSIRVWVADATDTLVQQPAVRSARIEASVEQKSATAKIVLQREDETGSKILSTAIDARRRVHVDAFVLADDESPGSGDWMTLFEGRSENLSFGGPESRLLLPCIDNFGALRRKKITSQPTYGSTASPVAMDTVIQQIFDDAFGSGGLALNVEGTITTTLKEFTVSLQSVADLIQQINDVDGSDLRYKWSDASQAFVPTLFEPARAKTTPDFTFTNTDYFGIPSATKVVSEVRSRVKVIYDENGSSVTVIDSTAEALWGEEEMVLDYSKDAQVTTLALATALAANVLADVSMPAVEMVVDGRFFPWVELGDLYRFPANNVHLGETTDLAVVGYVHEFTPEKASTQLLLRGTPSGGVTRWFNKEEVGEEVTRLTPSLPSVPDEKFYGTLSASFDELGNLSAVIEGEDGVLSWKVVGQIGSPPGTSTLVAATPINGQSLDQTDIGTLDSATQGGDVGYVVAIGYTQVDAGGQVAGTKMLDMATFGTPEAGIPDDSIAESMLKDGTVGAAKMKRQAQSFSSDVVFAAPTYTSINWFSGDVTTADGTTVTVAGRGSALTISGVTFIYFDGTTTLKTTTNRADLADDDVILLATAYPSSNTNATANIVPAVGVLGTSGNLILAGDNFSANSITAGMLQVLTLSAISADLGTVTAGTLQANVIVASDTFSASYANFSGNINLYGGSSTLGVDTILGTGGTADTLSTAKGQIVLSTSALGLYHPGETTTAVISLSSSGAVSIGGFNGVTMPDNVIVGGGSDQVGFYGSGGATKPTITGSRAANAALASLLTALASQGLITDSTT